MRYVLLKWARGLIYLEQCYGRIYIKMREPLLVARETSGADTGFDIWVIGHGLIARQGEAL